VTQERRPFIRTGFSKSRVIEDRGLHVIINRSLKQCDEAVVNTNSVLGTIKKILLWRIKGLMLCVTVIQKARIQYSVTGKVT